MSTVALMRGELRWFNESDDRGVLESDDGERIEFAGDAFAGGVRPVGRCAGTIVEFRRDPFGAGVSEIAIVVETPGGRARRRRS